MRVQAPGTTPKAVWDYATAAAIVVGSLGKLITDNVDGKISLAKADVSGLALEASITAAKAVIDAIVLDTAGIAGAAMRGTENALLAANYKQFTKGLTEQASAFSRGYSALSGETYADLVDISASGYLTGVYAAIYLEQPINWDIVIEIDGSEVGAFSAHPDGQGNIDYDGNIVVFETTWHANYKYILMITPMWRFDTSLKVRLYNNDTTSRSGGAKGSITYLTE